LNFFEPAYRRGCVLIGSESVARWDWGQGTVTITRDGSNDQTTDTRCDVGDTYRAILIDFLEAVAAGVPGRIPADQGLAGVRIAAAMKRSATSGQRMSPYLDSYSAGSCGTLEFHAVAITPVEMKTCRAKRVDRCVVLRAHECS